MLSEKEIVIVNAENLILGRMASKIAKMLLTGKRVVVVNAEKAMISGERNMVIEGYKKLWSVRTLRNPDKQGPRRPQSPRNIVKRAVRGMLPRKPKGKEALSNLKVYIGIPKEFHGKEMIKFEDVVADLSKGRYISVGELSEALGWRGVIA
ncbi:MULTISPECIES: 50S ribosomal protein L13 [Fervidicoccus]|uniref:Large ribosomal subunit protein uL13 n=1 Tax=Fervidicoccus fontis TaxID=683846 RepID=A0A2J6N4B4_9CREN|nr:MAG: 50S ribosomal protein L13 [Fervidicoccus fontis]HEW63660.1 50S ribosomal protein L13 [Fervidicoccus fontis]